MIQKSKNVVVNKTRDLKYILIFPTIFIITLIIYYYFLFFNHFIYSYDSAIYITVFLGSLALINIPLLFAVYWKSREIFYELGKNLIKIKQVINWFQKPMQDSDATNNNTKVIIVQLQKYFQYIMGFSLIVLGNAIIQEIIIGVQIRNHIISLSSGSEAIIHEIFWTIISFINTTIICIILDRMISWNYNDIDALETLLGLKEKYQPIIEKLMLKNKLREIFFKDDIITILNVFTMFHIIQKMSLKQKSELLEKVKSELPLKEYSDFKEFIEILRNEQEVNYIQ